MVASFRIPSHVVTGWGSSHGCGELAAQHGKRALLVTGQESLRKAGITQTLQQSLERARLHVSLFERVEPEPSTDTVDAGREAFAQAHCDVVVAAGGGSAIDVGKAIAALAYDLHPAAEFYAKPLPARFAPCIAIPTTAGTGAEVTNNSVLTDTSRGVKESLRGPTLLPAVAIVDAELTLSCPPHVTAVSGIDAFVQAIESYLSRLATPLTDALSLYAVELIAGSLLTVYQNGSDRPAREAMAYGSLLAGMALTNARLGAVHGIAHAVGLRYHIRHGAVCGCLLPHVLRFNRHVQKYQMLQQVLVADPAELAARFLRDLELPDRLMELREKDFDAIAAESMPSGSLQANPRTVSEQDIKDILTKLM